MTVAKPLTLPPRAQAVYDCILEANREMSPGAVSSKTGIPLHQVKAEILVLQCKKLLITHPDNSYSIEANIVPGFGEKLPPAREVKL